VIRSHSLSRHTAPTCCCSSPVSAETNGPSYSSIHSHMRKAQAFKSNEAATATQHPKISLFLSFSLSRSFALSHFRPLRVCVFPLFSLAFILHTHSLEGGDRFVFVGFNGVVAVCVFVCMLYSWLAK